MSDPDPMAEIPGRCNAKLRGKNRRCRSHPVKGKKRCRMHGGAKGSGRPPVHGRYSQRFKRTSEEAADLVEQFLSDPDLLDMRRPVAVIAAAQMEYGVIPDEGVIEDLARTKEQREEGSPPDPAAVERTRRMLLNQTVKAATRLQQAQQAVVRETTLKETFGKAVAPLFARMLERITAAVNRHVKDPEVRDALFQAMRVEVESVLVSAFREIEEGR